MKALREESVEVSRAPHSGRIAAEPPERRLRSRLDALAEVVRLGEGRLDENVLSDARSVLTRTDERLRLSGGHTVVALAGATGSGKSSLFNALAGVELSPVGVRRPTTGATHACVWGLPGSGALLEWLAIEKRHRYARATPLDPESDASLDGLVLLDLPDHDSTAREHRMEVDRLVGVADLIIWVVDPQKYADAAVHERYLRPAAGRQVATAVVLNQVDLLGADELDECARDLIELLGSERLDDVHLVLASTRSGAGLDELRSLVSEMLRTRDAMCTGIGAELDRLVERIDAVMEPSVATMPHLDDGERAAVVARLGAAVGIGASAQAWRHRYQRRGRRFVRWPVRVLVNGVRGLPSLSGTAWEHPDAELAGGGGGVSPQPSMVRDTLGQVPDGVTPQPERPWRHALDRACVAATGEVTDGLETEVSELVGERTREAWWWAVRVAQWALCVAAGLGFVWIGLLLGLGHTTGSSAGLPPTARLIHDRDLLPLAVSTAVFALLLGALLERLGRWLVVRRGREIETASRRTLEEYVRAVADRRVFATVEVELVRYASFRDAYRTLADREREHSGVGEND